MRIAFFGTPEPAVPSLRAFLDDPEVTVACVVTNPDRPRGRGYRLTPPPVKEAALEAGIEVWQPPKPAEIADDLRALELDACAVVAYGSILPRSVLDAGGKGFVNLHFSLLPAYRGAAPVPAALLAGDTEVGVSCFVLEEGMDTGPVLLTAATRVQEGETAGELTMRLAELGAPLLVRAVKGFVNGSISPTPQDHDAATYAPKISPEQARIDWAADATAIERAVRAYNPVPGAHTTLRGERLKIHRATPVDGAGTPGEVIAIDAGSGAPVVACGRGALRLDEVQPAGKARMDGRSFVNGYQPLGTRLGEDAQQPGHARP